MQGMTLSLPHMHKLCQIARLGVEESRSGRRPPSINAGSRIVCSRSNARRFRKPAALALQALHAEQETLAGVSSPQGVQSVQGDWSSSDWVAGYVDHQEQCAWVELDVQGKLPTDLQGLYLRNGPAKFAVGAHAVAHPFDGDGAVCSVHFQNGRAFFRSRLIQTTGLQAEAATAMPQFRGVFGTMLPGGKSSNAMEIALKNTANTGLLWWHNRLFALMEAGQPYELDPATLETLGPSTFDGWLESGLPFGVAGYNALQRCAAWMLTRIRQLRGRSPASIELGGDAMAAHYRKDPVTGRLVTLSYRILVDPMGLMGGDAQGMRTEFTFHEYEPDFSLHSTSSHTVDGYAFVHDFAITARHIVIMQNAITLHMRPLLDGSLCPIHCLTENDDPAVTVHIIPRATHAHTAADDSAAQQNDFTPRAAGGVVVEGVVGQGGATIVDSIDWGCESDWDGSRCNAELSAAEPAVHRTFTGPRHFVQHIANAWEAPAAGGAMEVTVQYVGYTHMPDFHRWSGPGHRWQDTRPEEQPCSNLHSITLSLSSGAVSHTRVSPRVCEFTRVNPTRVGLPSRYVYGAASLHPSLNRPQQGIAEYDTATGEVAVWSRGWRYYVGEPELVPGGGLAGADDERGCWLVCMCFNAETRTSEVVVLDAARVADGPVAVAELPTLVPHGLHGTWVPNDVYTSSVA